MTVKQKLFGNKNSYVCKINKNYPFCYIIVAL